jgi:hypothetical protein
MKKVCSFIIALIIILSGQVFAQTYKISMSELKDKIRGAWAAQVIGVTFGGPTEFQYRGKCIPDYQPIAWNEGLMKWRYENDPGLYDDIYMDFGTLPEEQIEGLQELGKWMAINKEALYGARCAPFNEGGNDT